jgi:creatinine amidohydrolase/Fe(II)-dependent formamide hydrolase-like protein
MEGFQTKSYGTHSFRDLPQSTYLFAEEVETSGFMGDPTRASAEKGKILYDKLIEYLVDYLNAFKKLDPALK